MLSNKEYTALSFGLDHIPTKSKNIFIEVEQFFQDLLRNFTHIPDNELTLLKTIQEKYSTINVAYKIKRLEIIYLKTKTLILKEDKRRDIAILDTTKYNKKCGALLKAKRLKNVKADPTAATERRIQKGFRKVKSKFSDQEYKRLYPTHSAPTQCYSRAK